MTRAPASSAVHRHHPRLEPIARVGNQLSERARRADPTRAGSAASPVGARSHRCDRDGSAPAPVTPTLATCSMPISAASRNTSRWATSPAPRPSRPCSERSVTVTSKPARPSSTRLEEAADGPANDEDARFHNGLLRLGTTRCLAGHIEGVPEHRPFPAVRRKPMLRAPAGRCPSHLRDRYAARRARGFRERTATDLTAARLPRDGAFLGWVRRRLCPARRRREVGTHRGHRPQRLRRRAARRFEGRVNRLLRRLK